MALRNVLREGDETLRKKSREVTSFDNRLAVLIDDMFETMNDSQGVGLAAPQVGVLRRVVVIDVGDGPHELVNPVILREEGDQYGAEGCLSIPNEWGMVHRPEKVAFKAQDRTGEWYELEAEGYLAVAVCHELDHLEGILFKDRADEMLDPEDLKKDE